MLTRDGCRKRIDRLRAALEGSWEAAVVHLPEHLLYLANFFPEPASLNLHGAAYLVVEKDGPAVLFADNWHEEAARRSGEQGCAADRVEIVEWYAFRTPALDRGKALAERVRAHLEALKVRNVYGEAGRLPAHAVDSSWHLQDLGPVLRRLREIKDPDELEAVRYGIRTAEAAHAASREVLRPGMTEAEVYGALFERAAGVAGGPFVFMCDIASGPRAARGGGEPSPRRIEEGECVILDLFPYVGGYRGDITNTLVAGGSPSAEQEEVFALVRAALEEAEKLLRPGTPVREIHRAIDAFFRKHGGTLVHHGGHGLGLGHPESPEIVPESDRELAAGMVMTLEPGLYGRPWGGIRLEHDYLITQDGCERLSSHRLGLA